MNNEQLVEKVALRLRYWEKRNWNEDVPLTHIAKDLIAIVLAAAPALPDGWVLVPKKPTEAMLNQAITVKKYIAQKGANQHIGKIWASEIYEAMINCVDCDCENEPLGFVSNECPVHK